MNYGSFDVMNKIQIKLEISYINYEYSSLINYNAN
jgi:hypothetical protein